MLKYKIGLVALAVVAEMIFSGCVKPDKNRAPTVAQVSCPETARVGDEISISVVSTDPEGHRIAYKLALGEGTQTEWSDLLVSGVAKFFSYTYDKQGTYGVKGIASDQYHKNSGWSEETYITVEESQVGPERIMFCVGPNDNFAEIAAMGITVVQHYSIYWESKAEIIRLPIAVILSNGLDYLDKAHSHGLKVLYCIKPMVHDLIIAGGSWDSGECRRIIEAFDSHPALWGWQAWDEPDAGVDNPVYLIPMETQREIYESLKQWGMRKPFIQVLRGATRGWHLVDLTIGDLIMPNYYVYDGTGHCWGEEPLVALEAALKQVKEYLDSNNIQMPVSFIMQCSMVPAEGISPYQPLPEGVIEDQFNLARKYGLCSGGLTYWAWNGGYYSPATSEKMRREIKNLLDKIK